MNFLLALVFLAVSCRHVPVADPVQSPHPTITPSPTQAPTVSGGVILDPVKELTTDKERAIIAKAEKKLADVTASKCFGDFISSRKMIQTQGKTPEQVLAHIRSLSGVVPVKMYYRCYGRFPCTSAVAYRSPPSIEINLNRAYFTSAKSVCKWASTIGHESVGHALGNYEHSFKWTPDRDFSVPYSINAAFEACCHE